MTVQQQRRDGTIDAITRVSQLFEQMPPIAGMVQNQRRSSTVSVVGAIHTIAIQKDIRPPEAAIHELSEEEQGHVRVLLAVTDLGAVPGCRPIEPDTVARVGRLITYIDQ